MQGVKIIKQFEAENKSYDAINNFLDLLNMIIEKMPEWLSNKSIFDVIEAVVWYEKINETKLLLAKLKIRNILWELNLENKREDIEKILKFINENKIDYILKIKQLDKNMLRIISNI